jgi:hypothetical protein
MSNQTAAAKAAGAAYYTNLNNAISSNFVLVSSSIGIPLNLLSILVSLRLMNKKTNMGFLYIFQSLADIITFLVMLLLVRSTPLVFPYVLENQSNFMCKLLRYLRRYPLHISSWMPVIITFDRLIFVLYDHDERFNFMKKKSTLACIILLVSFIIAILDIPNFFFYLPDQISAQCTAPFGIILSTDLISISLRTYIPFVLMIIFNIIMIRKILSTSQKANFKQSSLRGKEYQFTLAVMSFDVYFLITNFPLSVFYIVFDVNYYSGAFSVDPEFGAYFNMLFYVFVDISFIEQTFSFFMNLGFNKLFRKELLLMIYRFPGLSKFSRIQPSLTLAGLTVQNA